MSKEEQASVEDLPQDHISTSYFASCPFVSVLYLLQPYLVIMFFYGYLFSAPFHSSHAQFLSSDQSFRKTWPVTESLN